MQYSKELSRYRLEQAEQCLKSAILLLSNDDFKGAVNRSYYCIFHCIRSVLALEGVDFRKHSGLISYFRKEYIKTGTFDAELSDIISDLFQMRNESDYDDYYVISKEDVKEQVEKSEYFLNEIKAYLKTKDIL